MGGVRHRIARDSEGRVSMTDLWKMSGKGQAYKPQKWLVSAVAVDLIETHGRSEKGWIIHPFRDDMSSGFSKTKLRGWASEVRKEAERHGLLKVVRGRNGGTFAERRIALAYAEYLSPEIHLAVTKTFLRVAEIYHGLFASACKRHCPGLSPFMGRSWDRNYIVGREWGEAKIIRKKPSQHFVVRA